VAESANSLILHPAILGCMEKEDKSSKRSVRVVGLNSGLTEGTPDAGTFAEYLKLKGILEGKDNPAEKLVCIDFSLASLKAVKNSDIPLSRRILFQMEPEVVLPGMNSKRTIQFFSSVIYVGGANQNPEDMIRWPQIWPESWELTVIPQNQRKDRIVLINRNKVSFVRGELYSLRRNAVQALENLDLYGSGWGDSMRVRVVQLIKALTYALIHGKNVRFNSGKLFFRTPANWLGQTKDKFFTMSKYRAALVIENSSDYMSEKLFDAFFAGCMPIYVGPPVSMYGIPEGLVFQAEPNLASIQQAIERAKSSDFLLWQSKLLEFLEDPVTKEAWSHSYVYRQMLERVL
jgi:hypothetical protein